MKYVSKIKGTGRSRKGLGVLVLSAGLLVAGCESAGSEAGSGNDVDPDNSVAQGKSPIIEVARRIEPSVVQVNVSSIQSSPDGSSQEAEGLGSGVIYDKDGYIITNAHVVEGAEAVNVALADGSVESGQVVGSDSFTDIAVVKVDRRDLPAAEFTEKNLDQGQLAVAVGSPSGFQSTVTSGIISGVNREVPPQITGGSQETALVDLIQTDAAISPGSSGGALVDREAEVVGINVAYLPPAQTGAVNIAFAIPSATATDVADQIIANGEATHPYLGVSLVDLTPEAAQQFDVSVDSGAIITELDPDGPAAEAGLEAGGVITAVGSEEVSGAGDLLSALRQVESDEPVEVTVDRDGDTREFIVELDEKK